MTRNKPWRGNASPLPARPEARPTEQQVIVEQPQASDVSISHLPQDAQKGYDEQNTTATVVQEIVTSSPDATKNATNTEHEMATDSKLTSVPPTVTNEDSEDVLHIYHPKDEDKKAPLDHSPSSPSPSNTTFTDRRHQQYNRDTHEDTEDEDLLTALQKLIAGDSREPGAGPFGFLDVVAGALSDAFPRAFPPAEPARQHEQQRGAPVSEEQRPRASSPIRGHFHASSSDISLEQEQFLVAQCKNVHGVPCSARLDLNNCLSNADGNFVWTKGGNFKASARHIELIEGGKTLKAQLRKCDGRWKSATVHLPHRVSNKNGQLILVD